MSADTNFIDLLRNDAITDDDFNDFLSPSNYYTDSEFISLLEKNRNSISILSTNLCSLRAKFDKLTIYIEMLKRDSSPPSIICIQETWLGKDDYVDIFEISGYDLVTLGKTASGHGGLAMYVHNSIKYTLLAGPKCSETWEGMFIELIGDRGKKVIIGNIYRPPHNLIASLDSFIDSFVAYIAKFRCGRELVVAGDYNIDILKIGKNLHYSQFFESLCSLAILPRITYPTRIAGSSKTLIDNFYCRFKHPISDTSAGILLNNFSDHQPYFIILKLRISYSKCPKGNTLSRKGNQDSFINFKHVFTSIDLSNLTNEAASGNPNTLYDILDDALAISLNSAFPLVKRKFNKYRDKRNPWVTDEILNLMKTRDRFLKRKKKAKGEKLQKVNKLLKEFNQRLDKDIKVAKKAYYDKQFISLKGDIKKTWDLINDVLKKGTKIDLPEYFIGTDGERLTDFKDIAEGLNAYFSDIGPSLSSKMDPGSGNILNYMTSANTPVKFEFNPISETVVLKAIDRIKPKLSCGVDGISSKLLKSMKHELAPYLTIIINRTLLTGVFPKKLKVAKVIALHKKNDNSVFSNYRPISLLPSISKILERVIHDQIYTFLETNNLLYENQYGYRKCFSTEFASVHFIEDVINKMNLGLMPIAVFMDLSKSFDTIDHTILLQKLHFYNFSEQAILLIKNYLTDRTQFVTYQGAESSKRNFSMGVPQGSILGPLIFILYINDLWKASECLKPICYADDTTCTFCPNLNSTDLQNTEIINSELSKINNWFLVNKLSLNVSKTNYMIFHKKYNSPNNMNLEINGLGINRVSNFKFLGLTINENITWDNHIKSITLKINRGLGILKLVKKYLPFQTRLTIYQSLISCHFNNHILLWGKLKDSDSIFKLQKKAIRITTNSHPISHTSPLFKHLKILQFPDLYNIALLKFYYKFHHNQLPPSLLTLDILTHSEVHPYPTRGCDMLTTASSGSFFRTKSFIPSLIVTINALDTSVRDKIKTHSLQNLVLRLKSQIFETYETICRVRYCYPCTKRQTALFVNS